RPVGMIAVAALRPVREAIPAVDGLLAGWLERHLRRHTAGCTDDLVHLARAPALSLPRLAAIRAARRVVLEPLAGIELLLARRKRESRATLLARQRPVRKQHSKHPPCLWSSLPAELTVPPSTQEGSASGLRLPLSNRAVR